MNKVKILFLAAYPDASPLQLDEEIREITQKIRASEYRDTLDLVSKWAVRPDDLLQALNEHRPHIVHFSGHGSPSGEIILVDENLVNGKRVPKPIKPEAIKALFQVFKNNVQVILLNACYSRIQASVINETIDCVIGMNSAIGDQAAIKFAASFYRALGFGKSVKEAFEQGKVALLLEGIPEETTPELLVKTGVDPSLMFPVVVLEDWAKVKKHITNKINVFLAQIYYQIINDLELLSKVHSCENIWPLEIKDMVLVLQNRHPGFAGHTYDNITTSPAMGDPAKLLLLRNRIDEILERCDNFLAAFGDKLNPIQYELILEVSYYAQDVKKVLDDVERDIKEFGQIPYWFKDEGVIALVCKLDFLMLALMKVHRYWATLDGVIKE